MHQELNSRVNSLVGNTPTAHSLLRIIVSQSRIVKQETGELMDGIKDKNVTEIRDGLADVIVTTDGMYHRLDAVANAPDIIKIEQTVKDILQGYPSAQSRAALVNVSVGGLADAYNVLSAAGSLTPENTPEGSELEQAWKRDVLHACDSLRRNAYLLSALFGVDIAKDQYAVYQSNMSKFDTVRSMAEQAVVRYRDTVGIEVEIFPNTVDGVEYFVLKSAVDQTGTDGKDYPKGKFLKSDLFREPQFAPLPEDAPIHALLA